jgi:hypothetical protein
MMNRNTLVAVDHRRRLAVFYNGFRGFIVTRFDEANNVQLLRLVVEDVEDDELREIFTLGRLILDGFCEEDEETKGTKPRKPKASFRKPKASFKKSLDDCLEGKTLLVDLAAQAVAIASTPGRLWVYRYNPYASAWPFHPAKLVEVVDTKGEHITDPHHLCVQELVRRYKS